jgi:hypothetical protein
MQGSMQLTLIQEQPEIKKVVEEDSSANGITPCAKA